MYLEAKMKKRKKETTNVKKKKVNVDEIQLVPQWRKKIGR